MSKEQKALIKQMIFAMNALALECEKDDEFNDTLTETGVFGKDLSEGANALYDLMEDK